MALESANSGIHFSPLRDLTPWFIRLERLFADMTAAERRVGAYFLEHPDVIQMTITEVVRASGLGYGTIVRFCQKIGCSGFQEFKVLMARDIRGPGCGKDLKLAALDELTFEIFVNQSTPTAICNGISDSVCR